MIYTQRELQREIHAVQQNLTNEQLFLSPAYEHKLTEMGHGITNCEFEGQAHMYSANDDIAYTDGNNIFINYSSPTANSLSSRVEKHNYYLGANLHEHGHLLFTDFALGKKVREELKGNKLYPFPNENEYLKELLEFMAAESNNSAALQSIYHMLDNCIEDGFVDRAVIAAVPGYGECLKFETQVDMGTFSNYKEMKANNIPDPLIFTNLVLGYCVYGIKGYSDEEINGNELLKSFEECLLWLRKAVYEVRPLERKRLVNNVFCHLFHFIKQEAEKEEQEQQKKQDNNKKGNHQDNKQSNQQNNQQPNIQNNSTNSSTTSSQTSSQSGNQNSSPSQALNEALNELSKNMKDTEKNKHLNPQSPNKNAINDISGKMDTQSQEPSAKKSNSQQVEKSSTSTELENIAKNVAEEIVSQQQENEIKSENTCNVRKFLDGVQIHKNVSCSVSRADCSSSATKLYNDCHQELDTTVRRFVKDFEKEIKERQLGDTLTGLYAGKRLDNNHLYRTDKRLFSRKIMPEDIPDMAVGILIDCSGSMNGERIEVARKCAYITYSFCRKMNIPCFVFGHHTSGNTVILHSVADEHSLDNKDSIRIFDLKSGGSNRDGFALRYCLKKLEKIPTNDRLMLIISDGRPAHNGYGMESGQKDCQAAVHDAMKKGIYTVAAGIGIDASTVYEVYKAGRTDKDSASYLDISDLNRMPKAFIKIIKKRLES